MTLQSQRIVDIIKSIPYGKVLTYGEVATLADLPNGARQVSWLLRTQTEKENLPWHRIIGSGGRISIKDEKYSIIQKELLISEGIEFNEKNMVKLDLYLWDGL